MTRFDCSVGYRKNNRLNGRGYYSTDRIILEARDLLILFVSNLKGPLKDSSVAGRSSSSSFASLDTDPESFSYEDHVLLNAILSKGY
jgi:hypothetical protein